MGEVKGGDLVFLKVGKEILGQFIIGKVIFIENFKKEDFKWITKIEGIQNILEKRDYEKDLERISIVLIIQTNKIEQLITSPIEVPIVRKDWIILED